MFPFSRGNTLGKTEGVGRTGQDLRGWSLPSAMFLRTLEGGSLGKILLLLLIFLGAALYFPQTRPVVMDAIGPILNPVLTWQTKGEMDRIARELQTMHREGNDLPTPGESFQGWMDRQFLGGAKLDAWGVPYTLTVWRDSIGIVSNGPDTETATGDDIVRAAVIQRRNR